MDRFSEIQRKNGPDAIAGLITARCTNEELYLFQKLMRAGFQTNHLDSSARYGHLNFIHASRHALGIGRSPNDWEDLTKAKAVILLGSNITETNPLTAVRIKEAIRVYKAQVVVIDSAVTNMAKLASHPILIKPGTEGLVIDGLVKAALELDLIDETSVKKHPQAFEALKAAVAHVSLEQVAAQTGMSVESLKETAAIFAEAPRFHPNAALIKGVVCGIRVEEIKDPLMRKLRYLDKLIDELAKGKTMEKILRTSDGAGG